MGELRAVKKRLGQKSPASQLFLDCRARLQWLSGLYYADFISFYSPTQLCGGGTTKSNSNELPISVPLSFFAIKRLFGIRPSSTWKDLANLLP